MQEKNACQEIFLLLSNLYLRTAQLALSASNQETTPGLAFVPSSPEVCGTLRGLFGPPSLSKESGR
jgi:hypothetical protein